jgi:hypothetical protein
MKQLILGKGRFSGISNIAVKYSKPKSGSGNAGHGGYVKRDFAMEDEGKSGSGFKKKLKPLKFKM